LGKAMRKRCRLLVGMACLVLLADAGAALYFALEDPITPESAARIKEGMTYALPKPG